MPSKYTNAASWALYNTDSGEEMRGQFVPNETTRDIKNNWASHTTLNRRSPIVQFVNRDSDKVQFSARMYALHSEHDIVSDLIQLEKWATPSAELGGRPPILSFALGDGHLAMDSCVVESISGIRYGEPTPAGSMRDVTFTVSLMAYVPFSLDYKENYETRYHRVADDEFYEMLAQREYSSPMLGDVVRKRHPEMPTLLTGDVVKLPSVEGLRGELVTQESVPLKTAFGKRETPQRALRIATFNGRSRAYLSRVLAEY